MKTHYVYLLIVILLLGFTSFCSYIFYLRGKIEGHKQATMSLQKEGKFYIIGSGILTTFVTASGLEAIDKTIKLMGKKGGYIILPPGTYE